MNFQTLVSYMEQPLPGRDLIYCCTFLVGYIIAANANYLFVITTQATVTCRCVYVQPVYKCGARSQRGGRQVGILVINISITKQFTKLVETNQRCNYQAQRKANKQCTSIINNQCTACCLCLISCTIDASRSNCDRPTVYTAW